MQEKKPEIKEEQKIPGREMYEWVQALVCSVLAVVVLFTFVIRMIGVDGHSMVPTLQDKDRLLVLNSMLYDDYQYGDIVVLRKPTFLAKPIVKRVIATEGQTVDIDFEQGVVYVDGQALQEPYIRDLTTQDRGTRFPLTVAPGCIFVLGDNRPVSRDSRAPEIGQIDTREVLGKALCLMLPGTHHGSLPRDFDRIGAIG